MEPELDATIRQARRNAEGQPVNPIEAAHAIYASSICRLCIHKSRCAGFKDVCPRFESVEARYKSWKKRKH